MKNLVVLVLFFWATICNAQTELQKNKDGVYRAKPDSFEWVDVEITAHPEALRYNLKFSEAMANPGEKILGEGSEKILKLKPVFKKQVEVREYFILYNSQTNNIDYVEAIPTIKEKPFYLILFSIASILLMIISNILFKKGHDGFGFAVAFAAVAFALAALAAAALAAALAAFAAALAAVAFALAALAAAPAKNYKAFSIIFYILMVIHIVLLFV